MKRVLLAGTVLLLVMNLAGCQVAAQNNGIQESEPEVREQMIEAFGTVRCRERRNIAVDFPITVETVAVREGQIVHQGDVLASIKQDEMNAQIEMKKLQLSGERENLRVLNQEIDDKKELLASGQDPDLVKLKYELESAQKNLEKLLSEMADKKRLVAVGTLTQNEVELFQKQIDAAEKSIEDFKLAITGHDFSRKMEIKQLENQTVAWKNSIDLLQLELAQLNDKKVHDDITGGSIISTLDRALVEGVFVTNGDMPAVSAKLFSLIDINTQYVEARIPEEFIKDVKVGMEARVIPLADKTMTYTGEIVQIAQKATPENGETNVLVEIELQDEKGFLIPDFTVNVEIPY